MSYNSAKSPHRYQGIDAAFVTAADTAGVKNLAGKRFIMPTGITGTVTFRHNDGTLSKPLTLTVHVLFELGSEMTHLMLTGTTATNIVSFY